MAWKVKINQLMNEAEAGSPAGGAPVDVPVDEPLDADAAIFESLADELDLEDDEPVVVETPAVVPPVAEVTPPTVVTPAVVPAAVPSEPAKPEASAPTTVESPTPVAQTVVEPRREDVVANLTNLMAITNEDDIELLRTEPEKVIPKLMAGLFYDMHATLTKQFADSLPYMLQDVQTRVATTREAEESFYTQWPLLKDHKETVLSLGRTYRQVNPNATREQAIREIGAMAMVHAKIPFNVETGQAIAPAAAPATQAFRPVVTSGVTPAPSATPDEWSGLVEEFLREDLE